ncbi:MAG: hypothetical protein ACYTG6_03330 [Planctomycetota bacterium]|jgi:hypothetical protein
MNSRAVFALAPILIGATFLLAWEIKPSPAHSPSAAPRDEAAASDGTLRETAPQLEPAPVIGAEERGRRIAAEREVVRLTEVIRELRSAHEACEADAEPSDSDPEVGRTAGGPRFTYGGLEAALASVDWREAGDALAQMTPILAEVVEALAAGEPVPPSVGEVARLNGSLVTLALTLDQQDVPGTGVNGTFTHPSVQVNLVYETLRAAGLPLDPVQLDRLRDVGDRFVADDARRLQGYAETTSALRKVIDEAGLKDRFFAEVDAILNAEQRESLHPAALRGRLRTDLFSSGIFWMQFARPVDYDDREDLATSLLRAASEGDLLADVREDLVEDRVRDWAQGFSNAYLTYEPDPLARQGMLPIARVREAAAHQLGIQQALLDALPEGSAPARRIRQNLRVLVPVRQP